MHKYGHIRYLLWLAFPSSGGGIYSLGLVFSQASKGCTMCLSPWRLDVPYFMMPVSKLQTLLIHSLTHSLCKGFWLRTLWHFFSQCWKHGVRHKNAGLRLTSNVALWTSPILFYPETCLVYVMYWTYNGYRHMQKSHAIVSGNINDISIMYI